MNDPYTTPQMSPQPPSGLAAQEPKAIKVFGILHLIFGSLGVLSTAIGLVFVFFMKPFFNWLADQIAAGAPAAAPGSPTAPDSGEAIRLMGDIYVSQQPFYVVSSLVTFVLVALMLRAGFSLIKRKKSAAKRSNFWAWLAIGMIVVSLPVSLFYTLPAQREMQQNMNEALGVPGSTGGGQAEMIGQVVGMVIGFVFSIIYPVLALFFLRRKTVSDYLQEFGK